MMINLNNILFSTWINLNAHRYTKLYRQQNSRIKLNFNVFIDRSIVFLLHTLKQNFNTFFSQFDKNKKRGNAKFIQTFFFETAQPRTTFFMYKNLIDFRNRIVKMFEISFNNCYYHIFKDFCWNYLEFVENKLIWKGCVGRQR